MGKNYRKNMIEWLDEIGFKASKADPPWDWNGGDWELLPISIVGSLSEFTGQGDYIGGTVERANREAMLEDFPNFLTTASSGYEYEECVLLDAGEFRNAFHWPNHPHHDEAVSLVEAVGALHDYPCYDEEALSLLEQELIDEALPDAVKEIWRAATKGFDEDDVPFPPELRTQIESALGDRDGGSHCPGFETGCIVYFVEAARTAAQRIADKHVTEWKERILESLGVERVIPGSDCFFGWSVQSAEEQLEEIRAIVSSPKFPFEAIDAIRRIAALLNHPQEAA